MPFAAFHAAVRHQLRMSLTVQNSQTEAVVVVVTDRTSQMNGCNNDSTSSNTIDKQNKLFPSNEHSLNAAPSNGNHAERNHMNGDVDRREGSVQSTIVRQKCSEGDDFKGHNQIYKTVLPRKVNGLAQTTSIGTSTSESSVSLFINGQSESLSNGKKHHNGSTVSRKSNCSRCRKKQTSNVRIQCKMDQYLASKLPSMRKELSLSLRLPRPPLPCNELSHLKYAKHFRVEEHANGGAKILRLYWDEICHISEVERVELANEFLKESFREEPHGVAKYVISIVHNASYYMPDLLDYMADAHPSLTVKTGVLGHSESDIETTTISAYRDQVERTYSHGTFRAGPLHQVSLVGVAHEEVGGYFPGMKQFQKHFLFIAS